MSIIQNLKSEGVLKLHHTYINGHLLDSSGNGNNGYFDPTFPNTWNYTKTGLKFNSAYAKVLVADSPELRLEEVTFIFYNKDGFVQKDGYFPRLISNKGIDIYLRNSDEISIAGNTVTATADSKHGIGIYLKDGEASDLYLDGVYETSSGVASITADTDELYIGNLASGRRIVEGFSEVLIINRELTATEQAQVYGELANTEYPTIPEAKIIDSNPNQLVDGDMDAPNTDSWNANAGAVLTKEPNTLGGYGAQWLKIVNGGIANYNAGQLSVLTPGKTYRLTGDGLSDGTTTPQIWVGAERWRGSATADVWQHFDVTFLTNSGNVSLAGAGTDSGWFGFKNVRIVEVGKEYVEKWKTDWGVYTNGREEFCTDGEQVNNTPFYSDAGDFRVTMDSMSTNRKDIEYALDFNSGWTASGGVVIDSANSFTRTGSGAISSDNNIFEAGRRYRIRIAGTCTSTELRFYNNQGSSYRMTSYVLTPTFDITFDYTARTPWMMFYVTDNGSVTISNFTIEEYDQDIKVLECVDFANGTLKFPDWLGDSDITAYKYTVASAEYTKVTLSPSSGILSMDWGDKIALSDITGNYSIIKDLT